jgi:hypothetical protein
MTKYTVKHPHYIRLQARKKRVSVNLLIVHTMG